MIQSLHCLFYPVRHSTPSLWYHVYIVRSIQYGTVHRHYDTTSTLFVLSSTSQYTVTMIQLLHCLFFPVRHSTTSLWYNVHIVCSFRYVTVNRHYDTTFTLFVLSSTAQYTVTTIKRLHCLFYPVRHSTPSLWYNFYIVRSFRYVTVHRQYDTTSTMFVLSGTSQYTVTMIQLLHCLFYPIRHSIKSLWYKVYIVCSIRYVTVHRHYDTTFTLFVLSSTAQYTVTTIQRLHCSFYPVRHSTPSLWYNFCIVCSFRYVTVQRHYDTTSTLFVLSGTSQ